MPNDAQAGEDGPNEEASRSDKDEISPEKISFTMDKRIDLAISVITVLLGVFMIVGAQNIKAGSIPDPITSRGMPEMTGIFFIIGGIILAVMRLVVWSALPGYFVPAEGRADEEGHPASWIRAFGIILVALLWVWFLKPLGYLIVTPLFLLVGFLFMGLRSWRMIIVFTTIYTLATWYIFSQPLLIILPLGPLTSFARSLGLVP